MFRLQMVSERFPDLPGKSRARGGRSATPGVEAMGSDMAARKRRKPPPRRARRSLLARRPSLRLSRPVLEPHHVDIIALALIAIGIFLGGVAYLRWAGGAVGDH